MFLNELRRLRSTTILYQKTSYHFAGDLLHTTYIIIEYTSQTFKTVTFTKLNTLNTIKSLFVIFVMNYKISLLFLLF